MSKNSTYKRNSIFHSQTIQECNEIEKWCNSGKYASVQTDFEFVMGIKMYIYSHKIINSHLLIFIVF